MPRVCEADSRAIPLPWRARSPSCHCCCLPSAALNKEVWPTTTIILWNPSSLRNDCFTFCSVNTRLRLNEIVKGKVKGVELGVGKRMIRENRVWKLRKHSWLAVAIGCRQVLVTNRHPRIQPVRSWYASCGHIKVMHHVFANSIFFFHFWLLVQHGMACTGNTE